jgi:hypothetical protein
MQTCAELFHIRQTATDGNQRHRIKEWGGAIRRTLGAMTSLLLDIIPES